MKKCPVCEVVMHEVKKLDVLIDVCPKCMGVWLDKGELEKIISLTDESGSHTGYYKHDDHDDDDHEHKDRSRHYDYDEYEHKNKYGRKRKGGISEIFGDLFG